MPNAGCTHITVLLDRSGSMDLIRDATIEAYNAFLRDQRRLPGKTTLSLVRFDDRYELVYLAVPAAEAELLSYENFTPRGATALYDAMARAIDELGRYLASLPEQERPGRVLFVVVTDGMENASLEVGKRDVLRRVAHQRDKYGWTFVFLGAGLDVIAQAADLGISRGNMLNFKPTAGGIKGALRSLSDGAECYASSGRVGASSENFFGGGVVVTAEDPKKSDNI